jgi:hypothetical protein
VPSPPAQQPAAQPIQPVDPNAPAQPYQFPAKPQEIEKSPYDFFMEPPKQSRGGIGLGDASAKKFIFIVVAVIAFLGLLFGIMAMASKPTGNGPALTRIAQEQQEMIRVSADPAKNSHSDTVQNFAVTLQLGLTSAQQSTLAYMAKTGTKVSPKTLALGASAKTDQALASALAADTYDSTFESIMATSLNNYVRDLSAESKAAQTIAERQMLKKDLDSAQLLQKMLPGQTQP